MLVELNRTVKTEVLCSLDGIDRLYDEWTNLWQRSDTATAFQSPGWLVPWYRHIAGGRAEIVCFRREGRLIGLAPLHRWVNPTTHERTVLLAGTGLSDYLNVLSLRRWEADVQEALAGYLADCRSKWDVCDFHDVPDRSVLNNLETSYYWQHTRTGQNICPILHLPSGATNRAEVIPVSLEKKVTYYERRLARDGRLQFETVDSVGVPRAMRQLFALHGARWRSREQTGVLTEDQICRFHLDVAREMDGLGALRLYTASIDGHTAAIWYGFNHRRHTCYYLSGFDPALNPYSPGTLIIGHALDQAVREGALAFDFLRGAEPYKYRWGASDLVNYRVRLSQ